MSQQFETCASLVERLSRAVADLDRVSRPLELPPLARREWYELLTRKLLPQLGNQSFLIVAVVGGTNIGKSIVFNHLAGAKISSSSPLASGTKHPIALVPQDRMSNDDLQEMFPGFKLRPWEEPDQPLQADPEHILYYLERTETPENLVILDTPDVDSVAEVNWERADQIRQSADVLVAVLTQQKYNDAAVKEFFRKAAREDKCVLVVFNQVLLPEDEEYWPKWLETFCSETGTRPYSVYLAPNDRRAAEALKLPFYERQWPPELNVDADLMKQRSLMQDLSELRFQEIKIQALSGALRQLVDPGEGIPAWLKETTTRTSEYREALELMSSSRLVEIDRWPTLPNAAFITQIRAWWRDQREGWTAGVHGFYSRLGDVVAYPVRAYREARGTTPQSPFDLYREREWSTILEVLERTIERLTWLKDFGNPLLGPRLENILSGRSRAALIEAFRKDHSEVDFEGDVRKLVDQHLQNFREESPAGYRLVRRLDSVAAAARPAVGVALFVTGAGPLGEALAPIVADTAIQGVVHLAGDAVGGTVVTTVGDKVITDSASSGAGYLEAKMRNLHTAFAKQRADWMAEELDKHLLVNLPQELSEAARLASGPEFLRVKNLAMELENAIPAQPGPDEA